MLIKIRSGFNYALGNLVLPFGKTFKLFAFYVLVKPGRALTQSVNRFRKALRILCTFKGK